MLEAGDLSFNLELYKKVGSCVPIKYAIKYDISTLQNPLFQNEDNQLNDDI